MKLIRLHIENFGTLSNYDYEFKDDLNVIKGDNGSGKTTLGAFIKVMFFGFENEGKKSKKERTKYKPWQGGTYGGSIEFKNNVKTYILSRTFGTTQKDDLFELIDSKTKLDSSDYDSDNIGVAIFGIDRESFSRTLFISQNEYSHTSFTNIDAKIGNLVDATDDFNNHDTAVNKLQKIYDEIGSDKKGYLKEIKAELDELNNKVLSKSSLESSISIHESDIRNIKQAIEEKKKNYELIQKQLKKVAEIQDKQKDKKAYETILDSFKEDKQKYNREKANFPLEVPNQNDLNEASSMAKELQSLKIKIDDTRLSEEEQKQYLELKRKYGELNLNDIDFDKINNKITEIEEKQKYIQENGLSLDQQTVLEKYNQIFSDVKYSKEDNDKLLNVWNYQRDELIKKINNSNLSHDEQNELEELSKKFENKQVDLSEIDNLLSKWSGQREQLKKQAQEDGLSKSELSKLYEYENYFKDNPVDKNENEKMISKWKTHEELKNSTNSSNDSSPFKKTLLILGILLAILGVALVFIVPKLKIVGIVVVILGVIATICAFIGKNDTKANKDSINRIEIIEKEIQTYFLNHKINYDPSSIEYNLRYLNDQYNNYQSLKNREQESSSKNVEVKKDIAQIEKETRTTLEEYGFEYFESNVPINLNKIKEEYKRYNKLKETRNSNIENSKSAKDSLMKIDGITENYLKKYGYICDEKKVTVNLNEINRKYEDYQKLLEKNNSETLKTCDSKYNDLKTYLDAFFVKYIQKAILVDDYYKEYSNLLQAKKDLIKFTNLSNEFTKANDKFNEYTNKLNNFLKRYGFEASENLDFQLEDIKTKLAAYNVVLEA